MEGNELPLVSTENMSNTFFGNCGERKNSFSIRWEVNIFLKKFPKFISVDLFWLFPITNTACPGVFSVDFPSCSDQTPRRIFFGNCTYVRDPTENRAPTDNLSVCAKGGRWSRGVVSRQGLISSKNVYAQNGKGGLERRSKISLT